MRLRIVSCVSLMLAAIYCASVYGVSMPEGIPADLPGRSVADQVHGIAPGLNDATPVGSEYIPGEAVRGFAANKPDTPGNSGQPPENPPEDSPDTPGNSGQPPENPSEGSSFSEWVKEIAPGLIEDRTPVKGEFIPGKLISEHAKEIFNSDLSDKDLATLENLGLVGGITSIENLGLTGGSTSIENLGLVGVSHIPEPSLLIVGLAGLAAFLRRK